MIIICFDLWNTLVYSLLSGGASYEDVLVGLGVPKDRIYPVVRDQLMVVPHTYTSMVQTLFRHFGITDTTAEREALMRWSEDNNRVGWLPAAEKMLVSLKRNPAIRLALITNSTQPGWESVVTTLGVRDHFDRIVVSYEVGFSKPDRRMWQIVEAEFPGASQYIMVGDNDRDDLMMPRSMGWRTRLVSKDGSDLHSLFNNLRIKS